MKLSFSIYFFYVLTLFSVSLGKAKPTHQKLFSLSLSDDSRRGVEGDNDIFPTPLAACSSSCSFEDTEASRFDSLILASSECVVGIY